MLPKKEFKETHQLKRI